MASSGVRAMASSRVRAMASSRVRVRKYPKAVAKLDRDWQHLTAFYDFPAEHWRHLRTSNAIESNSKPDTPRGRNQEAGSDSDEGHPGRSLPAVVNHRG